MINRDLDFIVSDLLKRVRNLEEKVSISKPRPDISNQEWDNATLMQEWKISQRTTANYRQNGLESFKRGGRVYYSPEQRMKFIDAKAGRFKNE